MKTDQRAAVVALREALKLCELAGVTVNACSDNYVQVSIWSHGNWIGGHCSESEDLLVSDLDVLLAARGDV